MMACRLLSQRLSSIVLPREPLTNYGPQPPTGSFDFVRGLGAEGATWTNLTLTPPGRSHPLRGPAGRPGARPGVVAPARFVSQQPRQALRPATTVGLTRVLPSPGPG